MEPEQIEALRRDFGLDKPALVRFFQWLSDAMVGDFGVTFGDPAGQDTVLRSHWNNQATGIVADEVAELQLQPKNWGRFTFE